MSCVYVISNIINQKLYVGQSTKSIEERFKRHCSEAKWNNRKNMPIVNAIHKYGENNFKIKILEQSENFTKKQLDDLEIYWANKLNTFVPFGYNLKAGNGPGSMSEIIKQKISNSNKGKKVSQQTKERLRISHLGYIVKQSTKEKLSQKNLGKILTREHKTKIANSNTGKVKSIETKDKMRQKKLKFNYIIIDPFKNIHTTNNLRQFCRQNNLSNCHMNLVSAGIEKVYKNWKVTRQPV